MSAAQRHFIKMIVLLAVVAFSTIANAECVITSTNLTVTPVTASTGTSTPPTSPAAQSVTFTISGRYVTDPGAGTCRVAISFNRASLPASMARTGGGATLPYTIATAATGGNSLLFTGAGQPAAANRLVSTFASTGPNRIVAFTRTLTVFFQAQPSTTQRAGAYSDTISLRVLNISPTSVATTVGTRTFTVTGTVASVCTIGGISTPAANTATIPVSAAGVVTVAAINRSFASALCNSPTDVTATSLSGAVKRSAAAPSGYTNLINYSASATFSAATSTLNTATIATAVGAEAGTTATTAAVGPSGTLSVTITPQTPALPLAAGTYTDTLRITLTPQ